jgi:acyl-coenzyme A thioesterase PaaI-like protein
MSTERGRPDANHCFVCGPDNPAGLQIDFRIDGDVCRASFSSNENHVGYDSQLHGGILYSVLDDVMANWLFLRGERAVTGKCEIRFRNSAAPGITLLLESELLSRKGRMVTLKSQAISADDQRVVAEATATFVLMQ